MSDAAAVVPNKVRRPSGKRARIRRAKYQIDKVFPGRTYRQYVNMTQGVNRTKHGRKITIKARIKPRKTGIRVEWTLDTPDPPQAANRAGLPPAKRAFLSAVSSVTDAKGIAEVTLTLSTYGGDRFRVGARIKGRMKYKKYSGWFHVWRKLYFDIAEMKTKDGAGKYGLSAAIVNRIKTGYAKGFIELKDTGKRHLGDYKDNFDTVEKGFKWGDKYCANNGVPQKVHFCVIDHASPLLGSYGAKTKWVAEEANTTPFTSTAKIRPYDFAGHNWVVKVEYEDTISVLGVSVKTWKAFTPKVEMVGTRGKRKFKIDFTGTGLTPSSANKVKFRLTYLQAGSYGGWGGSNCLHLLICKGEYLDLTTEANANNQIVVACMHEVGHAMGLVPSTVAWHDASHSAHCKYNKCTMWFESSPGNEAFHDEATSDPGCRTFVRETELTKNVLQPKWKFPR